jgi:hypothetical protein
MYADYIDFLVSYYYHIYSINRAILNNYLPDT